MRLICGVLFLISAAAYAADGPSFAKDIAPILANRCSGCHAASVHMGSLNLETYEGLMTGGKHGHAIVPGNAAESRLYLMLTAKLTPAMPMAGTKLSDGEVRFIKEWIDAGAKPPAPGEALPMAPGATARIEPQKAVQPPIYNLAISPDGKSLERSGF